MPYYEFIWTDTALAKIELNDVSQDEVEAAICHPLKVHTSASSGRPLAMALAEDGRMLVCVYEIVDELQILPITAYFTKARS